MNYKIERVLPLTLGTTAQTVKLGGLCFLLENCSADAAVYFKEERDDGAAASASNAYALSAGASTAVPMAARDLSLVASAADTDARLLILETE